MQPSTQKSTSNKCIYPWAIGNLPPFLWYYLNKDDDDDVSPECLEHKIGIFNNQNRWDGNDAEHLQSEIKEKQMFTMNPDHCSSKLLTNGHEDTSWCRGSVNLLIDKTRYKKSGRSKGKDMCMILPKKDIICEGHDDIDSPKRKVCRYCQRT